MCSSRRAPGRLPVRARPRTACRTGLSTPLAARSTATGSASRRRAGGVAPPRRFRVGLISTQAHRGAKLPLVSHPRFARERQPVPSFAGSHPRDRRRASRGRDPAVRQGREPSSRQPTRSREASWSRSLQMTAGIGIADLGWWYVALPPRHHRGDRQVTTVRLAGFGGFGHGSDFVHSGCMPARAASARPRLRAHSADQARHSSVPTRAPVARGQPTAPVDPIEIHALVCLGSSLTAHPIRYSADR